MTRQEFLVICDKLGAHYTTNGEYLSKCPCHEDDTPSLSLSLKDDKPVFHCHAGCLQQEVFKACISLLPTIERTDSSPYRSKNQIEHLYHNEDGSIYGRVVRSYYMQNGERKKRMFSSMWDPLTNNWMRTANGKLKGISAKEAPLYNLLGLLRAPLEKWVFIVEGEKKVDVLKPYGHVAVCNQGGAGKWRFDLCKHFVGRKCILVPDINEPGYAHMSEVAFMLRKAGVSHLKLLDLKDYLSEGEDVYDYIEKFGYAEFKKRVLEIRDFPELEVPENLNERIQHLAKEVVPFSAPEKARKATAKDYQEFFRNCIPVRRDIFTGEGMYFDSTTSLWDFVLNRLPTYKVEAEELMLGGYSIKFNVSRIQDQLEHFIQVLEPEFLIYREQWDGVDRLKDIAERVRFKESTDINCAHFEYFLKDWWVSAVKRAHYPEHQNRMIVLQGGQGIGKDYLVDNMCAGLGQWAVPFQVTDNHNKDMYLQLSQAMVLKIGEFDKTGRMHVSILKDIITSVNTQIRGSYERKAKTRPSRASFISTANVEDILRDYTGNRRYLVFRVRSIDKSRPITKQDSVQIVAQAWHMFSNGWEFDADTAAEAEEIMAREIEEMTPDHPEEFLITAYEEEFKEYVNDKTTHGLYRSPEDAVLEQNEANGIIERVAFRSDMPQKTVRTILKRMGYQKVTKTPQGKTTRVYTLSPQLKVSPSVIKELEHKKAEVIKKKQITDFIEDPDSEEDWEGFTN